MAGTVKTPLNRRQTKKHKVFQGMRNIDYRVGLTFMRHHGVPHDKYQVGHPLCGRVTEVYKYTPNDTLEPDVVRHVVVTQHHNI